MYCPIEPNKMEEKAKALNKKHKNRIAPNKLTRNEEETMKNNKVENVPKQNTHELKMPN